MRLVHLKIHGEQTPSNLLNGLEIALDDDDAEEDALKTLCLVGANGSGKSQLLQAIAEIFQEAWHTHAPSEERAEPNSRLSFDLSYDISKEDARTSRVRLSRPPAAKRRDGIRMHVLNGVGVWSEIASVDPEYGEMLPPVVVGYTSGDNETFSLPFFRSRAAYAKDVSSAALDGLRRRDKVPDSRLLLIDYGTNLEVLIASLMLGSETLNEKMLEHASLAGLASWRCVLQLQPSTMAKTQPVNGRRGVKLTEELEDILERLRNCSTSQHHDVSSDTYTLDFLVDESTKIAFRHNWQTAADLYRSFHKFAMLNDLAIPKKARTRLARQIEGGRFATRLPEPQDEQKVFRFEAVRFHSKHENGGIVDYVALSDGEHQQAQILGVFSMIDSPNALFLLDEPESHFNPQWRVKFISRLRAIDLSTSPVRGMIMTSHAPFVPSDMKREHVVILKKSDRGVVARNPTNETFGASFDRILRDCFDVRPPISQVARDEIERLMEVRDVEEIENAIDGIGTSVERAFLVDHLNQLKAGRG